MTAAHCLQISGLDATQVQVKIGFTTRPKSINGEIYGVHKAFIHPSFDNGTWFNDIAILVLRRKIDFGLYVNPVCLPSADNFRNTVRYCFKICVTN